MEISYTLTERDFVHAFYAHFMRVTVRRWYLWPLIIFLALILLSGISLLVLRPSQQTWSSVAPLFGVFGVWAALLLIIPRFSASKQFRGQPAAQGEKKAIIDSAGIH